MGMISMTAGLVTLPSCCSFDMGPAHVVMLGSYVDYGKNSTQYQWLVNDLAKFNRSNTPWLIAMW